jgi:DNA-binding SARP family transcriptional activator
VEFRILGPLEVLGDDGRPVPLPSAKPRAVLALLLLHADRPVGTERLALALWGEGAPHGAVKTVQVHVSRLRKGLPRGTGLLTTPSGYELRLGDEGQLDARRFERLVADGRAELASGRNEDAEASLGAALGLWRGRPLANVALEPQREIADLEELRAAAVEELVEARLALGRHGEVIGDLERLIHEHPYRERPRGQLMLALYRNDRQADALAAYHDARGALVELGIEPGERLRALERAILEQDPALSLTAPAEGSATPAPAEDRPARRLVSVVLASMAETAAERLDPEATHHLLARYADACGATIERHGGAVERFAGDTVVGVFGQDAAHDDDALRAARAAIEMREAGAQLGAALGIDVRIRVGAEAGEVFVGATPGRARFAAGDAFTVAAGLEQSAPPGEILVGETLLGLLGATAAAEPVDDLTFAGRGEPVRAWRLLGVDRAARPPLSPFVGRLRELSALRDAFAHAREHGCTTITVAGPAGQGKSRLALELAAELGGAATVVVGRCPSYGDGMAHRPLAEIVGQLGDVLPELGEPLAGTVMAAVGADATAQPGEAAFAIRRLFERAAEARPLVAIIDDLHWAEPPLLDLLEYLAAFATAHPILLVCLARPELFERRPGWSAAPLALDPLSDAEAQLLIGARAEPGTAERIVETAEGNPLFLEQLVAVGATGERLPTTIQAVLAARLDRLPPEERMLLEDASVEGRSFHVGALERAEPQRLVSLVRKGLIRGEPSDAFEHEDAFRFSHALIREAAYRRLPKQRRSELHERLARWLDGRGGDEAVGHHLAEAARHRAELGRGDPDLAREAAARLGAAAEAALTRGDPAAGARLLERAAALLAPAERAELLPQLGAALFQAGEPQEAMRVLDEAVAAPAAAIRSRAEVERELVRLEVGSDASAQHIDAGALAADERGQYRLWLLRGQLAWYAGQVGAADAAWAEAASHAAETRDVYEVTGWRAIATVLGPTPVPDAIRRCEAFRERVRASRLATASTLNPLALLHAMQGDFEAAGRLVEQASAALEELGGRGAGVSHLEATVRLLAGQPELAEAALRADLEPLSAMGGGTSLATTTALLAQAMFAQGHISQAAEMCRRTERHATPGDTVTQAMWRGVQARILAASGRYPDAEALAREAVALVEPTDLLSVRGDAMLDLAHVLRGCERAEASDRAVRAGLALYERKGNHAAATRARALLSHPEGGT